MLSWVVKVVPQPPEPPPKKVEEQKEEKPAAAPPPAPAPAPPPAAAPPPATEKKVTFQDEAKNEASKADKPKQEAPAAEGNGPAPVSQPGVLMWISGALPQPVVSPKLSRANSTTKEEETTTSKPEDEKGMIAWIAQGLEKVVPQPELKSKESPPAEQPAEVRSTAATPAPEPQVTVVEVKSEVKEDKTADRPVTPRMIDWIKQGLEKVVPQPEIHSKTEGSEKTEAPAATKEAPAPEPPPAPKPAADTDKSSKEAEQPPNVVNWIVTGFGRMLPQPVQKQDAAGNEVQNISIIQKTTDLVLEDIEQDKEVKEESQNREILQSAKEETEDAETQVDQLTPLMETIKKEAGEAVLAHMEERLQQDRLEAARMAEEMARKAAEEAVRQLEVEQSAKIVIETLPESNEPLPNILEEENEDEPECLVDVCPAEDKATPLSTDVEPASERRDLESPASQTITEQPQPQAPEAPPTTTDQTSLASAAAESGAGVPDICSPIKSFLLRFPLAADCLETCRTLVPDHCLRPPKLSMPTLPPELSQLTQELLQLPAQARQCCMSVVSHFRGLHSNSQHPQQP